MNRLLVCAALCTCCAASLFSQINFSAHDTVPPYLGPFRPGANMGWHAPWTDDQLADLAAGNPGYNVEGAGVKAFRPFLPEYFLEQWGYDIRLSTFMYYDQLGLQDNVVFIGYPSTQHRDAAWYCPGEQSHLFANMYLPIWDGGTNGTPVNEQNYYALYLWKMVNIYKDYTRFWEIWNEPDQDYTGNAWKPVGWSGNWWENTPQPCDYQLKAPIYHYIRLLRISYEVIKSLDPDAYVTVGGLGYPAFLDVLLRNTDNPNGGTPTWEYPLTGGAYFDALAYHSYPHLDGSLRHWDNSVNGFVYTRHSDAAAEGVIRLKNEFEEALQNRGYDGVTFPEKKFLVTEGNLPRKSFGDYVGTEVTQRNFILKTLGECQRNRVCQYDVFIMGDFAPEWQMTDAFQTMGLYKWLSGYVPYNPPKNDLAVAYKTYTDLLFSKHYDADRTALLAMPPGTKGIAFLDKNSGNYTYMLWAKTSIDQSEAGSYVYWLPQELGLSQIKIRNWDYSATKDSAVTPADYVKLTASPIFVTDAQAVGERSSVQKNDWLVASPFVLNCSPNPFSEKTTIQFYLPESTAVFLEIFDLQGHSVSKLLDGALLEAGAHEVIFKNTTPGLYLVKCLAGGSVVSDKMLCR